MRYLTLLLFISFLYSGEVKLSLFVFDDIEQSKDSKKFTEEVEKSSHVLKIYGGSFAKPKEDLDKLSKMNVDVALYSNELLAMDYKELKDKPVHLLTSNLLNSRGDLLDTSWVFTIEDINFGVFGLTNYNLTPPKNFSFNSIDTFFACRQKVKELKAKGVDFIILICSLDKDKLVSLIKKIEGIDVVVSNNPAESLPFFENNTLIYFQNSHTLGKLDLLIEKKNTAQGTVTEFYPTWKKI